MRLGDGPPVAEKNDPMMPVAWTKTYQDDGGKKGRVFATTMGSAADFESAALRKLIINGVFWALRLESKIPKQGLEAGFVGEFKPSQYGFTQDEYWVKRNLRPSDFAW
jgi:hypothetical protein